MDSFHRSTCIALLVGFIISALFLVPNASAQPSQPAPSLTASYTVSLDEHYSLFGDVLQHLDLQIYGTGFNSTQPLVLQAVFSFDLASVSGLGPEANQSLTRDDHGNNYLTLTFPPSTGSFNITVSGTHSDYSVLLRSSATVSPIAISLNAAPYSPTSSSLTVKDPPGMDIFSVSGGDPGATFQTTILSSSHYVVGTIPTSSNVLVLYQSSNGDVLLLLYIALIVVAVFWAPFLLHKLKNRTSPILPKIGALVNKVLNFFTSKRLLEIFVLISLAMLGIALIFGPSPTPRAYLAATPATTKVLGPVISESGFQYFTPANAGDQFVTMSTLGNYDLVIIADYPPSIVSAGIGPSHKIIVMTDYAPPQYVATLKDAYTSSLTIFVPLNNTQQLSALLNNARFYVPASNLGLLVSESQYRVALVAEAVLTLTIIFVALAFLARILVEQGEKGLGALALGAFYCIAIFMATTIVFIQTSVLLGLPVALHAGISTVESAVGTLGFGGGSRPRQVLGTLGFIFGAIAGTKGRMKIDRVGIFAFIGLIAFVAIDPLSLGQAFYQLLVSFTTATVPPTGVIAIGDTRGTLGTVMGLFGWDVSWAYYPSHGSVLFFLTATPFALFSRLRKSTATFLLMFTALVAPLGFLRVADLNPTESMASAFPGIALGLCVAAAFLALSFVESKARKSLPTI